MPRYNALFSVLVPALLAAPAVQADEQLTAKNLRHTTGHLARNAVAPRAVKIVSTPWQLPARDYEAEEVWVDEGVLEEQEHAELLAALSAEGVAPEILAASAAASDDDIVVAPTPASPVGDALALAAAGIQYAPAGIRIRHRWHPQLNTVVELLEANPTARIELIGHADNTGDEAHNQALSVRRAQHFRRHLVERGVDGDRISVTGVGSSQPAADNATPEGRASNRRVEIRLAD